MQKFTWKTALGLILGVIVYLVLNNTIFNFSFQGIDNQKLIAKEWVTMGYGKPSITISTPEKLTAFEIGIPAEVVNLIDKMESFKYENGEKLAILANIVVYDSNAGEATAEGAAEGSIKEMKSKPGVKNFIYQNKKLVIENVEGVRQDGNFTMNNSAMRFVNLTFAKKNILWQVTILTQQNDNTSETISEKIIKSIKFDKVDG
jgi:hypothetical protein